MSYQRKTADEWQVHVDYGQGFEEVTCADTYRVGRDLLRDYRENEPGYPAKLVCKRVPINT